jgi:hypothetical protein
MRYLTLFYAEIFDTPASSAHYLRLLLTTIRAVTFSETGMPKVTSTACVALFSVPPFQPNARQLP